MSLQGTRGLPTTATASLADTVNRVEEGRRAQANVTAKHAQREACLRGLCYSLGGLVLVFGGLVAWLAALGVQHHVHVVKMDAFGQTQELEALPARPLKPEQTVIRGVLQSWLESVRWISSDRRVFTREWDKVEEFTTAAGLRQLHPFRLEQDQRQRLEIVVEIAITAFQPIARQSSSYTLKWCEEAYDRQRQRLLDQSGLWEVTLRVADFQGKVAQTELELRRKKRHFRNVYGVFVDEMHWTARPLPEGSTCASVVPFR